jgi:hypothetical protein
MTPDAEKPKENSIQACVKFLEENEFIRLISISESYRLLVSLNFLALSNLLFP